MGFRTTCPPIFTSKESPYCFKLQRSYEQVEMMNDARNSTECFTLLSQLLLETGENESSEEITRRVESFGPQEFGGLWGLAASHHVIMRAFPPLQRVMAAQRNDKADWVDRAIAKEQARIQLALSFLSPICEALEDLGDVIVIKSLDHWPDLGSDLDLYTNGESVDVVAIMRERFKARLAERSWGDRLANKWNFIVPGLPELVELHIGRLGQTGEQIAVTRSVSARTRTVTLGHFAFNVPAPEGRIGISTLPTITTHY